LTNNAFIEGFRGRNYSAANAYFFQDQRSDVSQKTVPVVVPELDYAFVGEPGRYGGRWSVEANMLNLLRNTGNDTRRLSFKTEWQLPYTSRIGELYTMFAGLQTDAYWVHRLADPENPSQTRSGLAGRFFPQVGLNWRFPLARSWGRLAHVVEPIAGVIVGPNGGNPDEIPNEDSIDFELDDTNLTSSSRFTGLDRVEGGPRAYYGLKTSIYGAESGRASAFFGQSFRLEDDGTFKKGSGLDGNFSDFVGRAEISPPKYFTLLYRFRADNEEFNFKRNELKLTAGLPELLVSANYLFVGQQEGTDPAVFKDREEITLSMSSRITERLSIGANTRHNLAEDGGPINRGFRLTYRDSCFMITGSFTRSFTADRDIKPTDTLLVRVTLRTLGSFGGSRVLSQPDKDKP
jgi:LPS-assembly protein